jgi:hypothetical protein
VICDPYFTRCAWYLSLLEYIRMLSQRKAIAMQSTTRIARHRYLAALLVVLCAWFALPATTPARADDNPPSKTLLTLGQITKGGDLGSNNARVFTLSAERDKQMLIGAVNLYQGNDESRRTAPKVTVSCPGIGSANAGEKIPADGGSIVSSGVSSSAVFCTPRGKEGSPNTVTVDVTITNTNNHEDIGNYGVFAIQIDSSRPITLPDNLGNIIDENFPATHVAIYSMAEQKSINTVQFLLQYRGQNASARAYVYRDTNASAGCTATSWWQRPSSDQSSTRPASVASCNLNNGDSTINTNYLVVLNTLNSCVRFRAHLATDAQTLDNDITAIDLGGSCPAE